ncbi:unnamed protein product [Effrenium voratum]|nr:unnamed protein product [Effrenium voratum]
MPRYVIRGQSIEADSVDAALKLAGGGPAGASPTRPYSGGFPPDQGFAAPLSGTWASPESASPRRFPPETAQARLQAFGPRLQPAGSVAASIQKPGELRRVSNDTKIQAPDEPTFYENTLLFLPEPAVNKLKLEPNMSDKGDTEKELWFGRVWELRELLRAQRNELLAREGRSKREELTPQQKADLDNLLRDPKRKNVLLRMAATWKGAVVRKRNSLNVLNTLRFAFLRGSVIYAHGSGGCSWDNFRICRMISRMGLLVIAPDGFAYPKNTAMGQKRHKDLQPLKKASDEVDYWANDLVYTSGSEGSYTYSTKAESVLEDPDKFRDLYEQCYRMRQNELHLIISKLPRWVRAQGFFIGGTSEGAMTVARFDDQRYGRQVLGRFINSFSIEYCYFTPNPDAAKLGGNLAVPTLNIIGTHDEYFGAQNSVAAAVKEDKVRGFGDAKLDGHGFDQLMEQEVDCALICQLEEGKHSPCESHDNFLRKLFQTFFTRPADICFLHELWKDDPISLNWVKMEKMRTKGQTVTKIFVPKMDHPVKVTLAELENFRRMKKTAKLNDMLKEEEQQRAAKDSSVKGLLAAVKRRNKAMKQPSQDGYSMKK